MDGAGNLYGTTVTGQHSIGTVFQLDLAGKYYVLHAFSGGADGEEPYAGLIQDHAGNLYGTATFGGDPSCDTSGLGCGTIFKVNPQTRKLTVLHSFAGHSQGNRPAGGLARDAAGNLYGVTTYGGDPSCRPRNDACGVIYKLSKDGTFTVLHAFKGTDGDTPNGNLAVDRAGNLYGTTTEGGSHGAGTVYKVNAHGKETVLYNFLGGADGAFPFAGLIRDAAGNLYGTTYEGGGSSNCFNGCGTVFKLDASLNESVLYPFQGGSDGAWPQGNLMLDGEGNLYGTTTAGGSGPCQEYGPGCGTVFKVDATGTETILYTFMGGTDSSAPFGSVIADGAGNLYGTASGDSSGYYGVVFRIAP